MAYEMTIHLTDDEYAALAAEAARTGKRPETLLHDIMRQRLQPSLPATRPLTQDEFLEQQYREGKILNIPTRRSLTPEEQAERERLVQLFAGGKPASEMVIEDRGPLCTLRQATCVVHINCEPMMRCSWRVHSI